MPAKYANAFRMFLVQTKKFIGAKTLSVAAVAPIFRNADAVAFHSPEVLTAADQTVFMFYDLHYPSGDPGPVTSVKWVSDNLEYLQRSGFPLEKSWLGTPLYGYAWKKGKTGRTVSRRYAEKHKAETKLHESGCLELSPKKGETAYVAGEEIDKQFRVLAARYAMRGLAYWRLGFE